MAFSRLASRSSASRRDHRFRSPPRSPLGSSPEEGSGGSTRSSGGAAGNVAPGAAGFGFPSLSKIFSSRRTTETPAGLDDYVNDLDVLASKVERKRKNMNNV